MSETCELSKTYATIEDMTIKDAECIFCRGKRLSEMETYPDPYLIIRYGPTGSGKSSRVVKDEIEALGRPYHTYVEVEIDDLVEPIESFRAKSMNLKNQANKNITANTTRANSIRSQLLKNTSKAYFNTRRNTKNSRLQTLEQKREDVLERALKGSHNVIYDTTGGTYAASKPPSFQKVIEKALHFNPKYKVVVIYPIVSKDQLAIRVVKRAENKSNRGKTDRPIYRGVNTSGLSEAIENAHKNFTEHILPQMLTGRIYKIVVVSNE
jgi:hypothetical protein